MSKTTQITRPLLKSLRVELDNAIKKVLANHGLQHNLGSMNFDSTTFTTKLSVGVAGLTGESFKPRVNKAAKYLETFHVSLGIKKEHINKWFKSTSGKELKLVGYNSRAPKNPLVLEDRNGTTYKAPQHTLEAAKFLVK